MKCFDSTCQLDAIYLPVLVVDFSSRTAKGMIGYFGVQEKQSCKAHAKGTAVEWMTPERLKEMERTLQMAGQEMQPITGKRLEFWPIDTTQNLQIIK